MSRPRFEPRYARSDLTLANFFTALRVVLAPFFGWLWLGGENERALWVFGCAAATDLVDGFLARWLNQQSRLGALLDPIADKLLILVALLAGVKLGLIPLWLAAIVIGRDFLLLVGVICFATIWRGRHGPAAWRPTRIGKYAMLLQSVSVAGVVLDSTLPSPISWLRGYVEVGMALAALFTILAWLQYTLRAVSAVRQVSSPA